MKKSAIFYTCLSAVAAMLISFTGCNQQLSGVDFDDATEYSSARYVYKSNLDYNVIYTRSLSYIPHPEYYTHINLFSLKLTNGSGGLDSSKFFSRFPKDTLKNFKKNTGYTGKLMLCLGSDAEQAAYIYKSSVNE